VPAAVFFFYIVLGDIRPDDGLE